MRLVRTLVATAVLAALAAAVTSASSGRETLTRGRPPAPAPEGYVAILFYGNFANPGWRGRIDLVVSSDGRTVTSVGGIAPGTCDDKTFGHLLPGKDGAAGPIFEAYVSPARIAANGAFTVREHKSGQRRPFKPKYSVAVSGVFAGNTVRGTVRASRTSTYDTCKASARFSARRSPS
jgi:hypothetical protein